MRRFIEPTNVQNVRLNLLRSSVKKEAFCFRPERRRIGLRELAWMVCKPVVHGTRTYSALVICTCPFYWASTEIIHAVFETATQRLISNIVIIPMMIMELILNVCLHFRNVSWNANVVCDGGVNVSRLIMTSAWILWVVFPYNEWKR